MQLCEPPLRDIKSCARLFKFKGQVAYSSMIRACTKSLSEDSIHLAKWCILPQTICRHSKSKFSQVLRTQGFSSPSLRPSSFPFLIYLVELTIQQKPTKSTVQERQGFPQAHLLLKRQFARRSDFPAGVFELFVVYVLIN